MFIWNSVHCAYRRSEANRIYAGSANSMNFECDRITRLIGETNEMARLKAGDVTLQFAPQAVGELISAVFIIRTAKACKVLGQYGWKSRIRIAACI